MTDFTFSAEYPGPNGDLELEVEITVEITSSGYPARGPSLSSPGEPAEAPEWQITTIEVNIDGEFRRAEYWFTAKDLDHLWSWAESQVDPDSVAQALRDEAEAAAEYAAEQRRDPLE